MVTKSPNIISAQTFPPESAIPAVIPTIVASLIGVVITCFGYLLLIPLVALNAPP